MNENENRSKGKRMGMVKSVIAATLVLCAAVTPYVVTEQTEESDGAIGLAAAFAIGFAIGLFVGISIEEQQDGGSQEEVNAVLRQSESEKIVMAGETLRTFAGTVLPGDASLWAHTNQHWANAAELAVATLWEYGQTYDPNAALENSNMRDNLEAYTYAWQSALDNAYTHTLIDHLNGWRSHDYTEAMTADLVWSGGSASLYDAVMDFCTLVSDAPAGTTVYIDASREVDYGTYDKTTSGTLYKLSPGSVVLRNMDTGRTVTLVSQNNDLSSLVYDGTASGIESGLYRIETAGVTLAGPLSRSGDKGASEAPGASVHSADPAGALVYTNGSSAIWFTSSDDVTTVHTQTSDRRTDELYIQTGYVNRGGTEEFDRTYLTGRNATGGPADLIVQWNGLIKRMNYTVERAASAGETVWLLYDHFEESVPLLSPSSIFTSVDGVNMNAVQSAALYVQRMQQSKVLFDTHGDGITEELAVQAWNPDGLDLYVLGDLYYNGELYSENAVFTPYNSLSRVSFAPGETTSWSNTGYVMMFGTSDDIEGWTGPSNTSEFRDIAMGPGWTIDVKQVSRKGTIVSSASIDPVKILKGSVDPGDTPGVIAPPEIESNEKLLRTIAYVTAAALFLLGAACIYFRMFRLGAVLIAIGLICAGLGAYAPNVVGWFV